MSPSSVDPRKLPLAVRRTLAAQCDGDWDRVTTDGGGGFVVHNNAFKAAAYIAGGTVQPVFTPPAPIVAPAIVREFTRREPKRPARPQREVADAEVRALKHLIESRPSTIRPGVNVVSAADTDRAEQISSWRESSEAIEVDWTQVSDQALDMTAHELLKQCEGGLPPEIPFLFHPEVLAMEGFKDAEDEIRATLRYPDRVEIRPETGKKRYPILGFWRGDVNVILGMRQPNRPAVIAAYYTALLMPDIHRVRHVGGGGAKREDNGLPRNPGQVIRALRALGAEVANTNPRDVAGTASVTFEGQELGSISVGRTARATCERDWQRMQRKIEAIKRRQEAKGA